MTPAFWTLTACALIFGAIVGSFLNVVIYRVPAGESVVSPPSRCPACETPIRWYDNIPVVSWFVLGAECRACGAAIPWRYAAVEAAAALLAVGVWLKSAGGHFDEANALAELPVAGMLVPFFLYFAFLALLVVIALVDLDHYIIPHEFTLPGIAVGLASPWLKEWLVAPGAMHGFWPPVTPTESALGCLFGGLAVLTIYVVYFALRGLEGLGGGDVTLMALVGAWLGWPALIFVFFAASLQGTLAAAVAWVAGSGWLRSHEELFGAEGEAEKSEAESEANGDEAEESEGNGEGGKLAVPFGPFIVLAAVEHFFLGPYLPKMLSMGYLYDKWYWFW